MSFGDWLSKINNDGHVAVGTFMFTVGAAIHYFHGLDASFVTFTTTILGFLGGHAYIQSRGNSNDTPSTDGK